MLSIVDRLSGTASTSIPSLRFVHDPLPEKSIRLFRIKATSPRLEIELRDFSISKAPQYEAISYCWGQLPVDREILCNGRSYRITQHLLEGLCSHCSVFNRRWRQRWLWVDAVSIKQDDVVEKAQQVAHMGQIFSGAHRVVVWLGSSAHDSDMVFDRMKEVTHTIIHGSGHEEERAKTGRNPVFLAIDLEYWKAACHLLRRGWFKRLWIVQEAVVARELVLLCGRKYAAWSSMYLLCVAFGIAVSARKEVVDATARVSMHEGGEPEVVDLQPPMNIELERVRRWNDLLSIEDTPSSVLKIAAYAETHEPLDRVYALIGIMHPYFQQRIVVDYSPAFKVHYWKAYANFIRLVRLTGNAHVIWDHRAHARIPGQPTWCINFNGKHVSSGIEAKKMISVGAGIVSKSSPWTGVSRVSEEDLVDTPESILIEHALILDKVATVVELPDVPLATWVCTRLKISAVLDTLDRIYTLVKAHPGWSDWSTIHDAAIDITLVAEQTHESLMNTSNPQQLPNGIKTWFEFVVQYLQNPPDQEGMYTIDATHAHPPYLQDMSALWRDRKFFITRNGWIGVGPLDTQPGDTVCVILKARLPQLFRPTEQHWEGQQLWEVVGNGYVDGMVSPLVLPLSLCDHNGRGASQRLDIIGL